MHCTICEGSLKHLFLYTPFQIAFSGGEMGDIRQSLHSKKNLHLYFISVPSFVFCFFFSFSSCSEGKPLPSISSWCSNNQVGKVQDEYLWQISVYRQVARLLLPGARELRGINVVSVLPGNDQNTILSSFFPSPLSLQSAIYCFSLEYQVWKFKQLFHWQRKICNTLNNVLHLWKRECEKPSTHQQFKNLNSYPRNKMTLNPFCIFKCP